MDNDRRDYKHSTAKMDSVPRSGKANGPGPSDYSGLRAGDADASDYSQVSHQCASSEHPETPGSNGTVVSIFLSIFCLLMEVVVVVVVVVVVDVLLQIITSSKSSCRSSSTVIITNHGMIGYIYICCVESRSWFSTV